MELKRYKEEFTMATYTREKDCVLDAREEFYRIGQQQLIFRKGRKYVYVTGELTQSSEPFKNIYGQTLYYSKKSDICKEYESNGYELRGWITVSGCFKNN
jgi:hypothetical protein